MNLFHRYQLNWLTQKQKLLTEIHSKKKTKLTDFFNQFHDNFSKRVVHITDSSKYIFPFNSAELKNISA